MAQKNLVKTNYPSIRSMIESADIQDQLLKAMSRRADVDQMSRVVLTTIRTNQKLLECSQPSLLACLFACAQLRLSPEPFLGQAYFVPFWNSKLGCNEATFIPGYKGLITLWRRTGEGHNIAAKVVYERDEFSYDFIQWELGNYHSFVHKPYEEGDRGDLRGAWAVLQYKDGHPAFEYMLKSDLEKRKNASKSRDRQGNLVGPWVDWPDEMARKSVIKYALKTAPMSIEDTRILRAAHAEDLALSGQDQKSLFLPGPEPIEIEASIEGGDRKNPVQIFDDQIGIDQADPDLIKFLEISAGANSMSVDEVKEVATQNIGEFKNKFYQWRADHKTTPKKQEPPKRKKIDVIDDTESAFINDWIRLQKSGFKPYIEENIDLFRTCSENSLNKAKRKWVNLYGADEPWPGDVQKMPETEVVYDPSEKDENTEGDSKGEARSLLLGGSGEVKDPILEATRKEMLEIKVNYPSYFLKATQGRMPTTELAAKDAISKVYNLVDQDRLKSSAGIPNA